MISFNPYFERPSWNFITVLKYMEFIFAMIENIVLTL